MILRGATLTEQKFHEFHRNNPHVYTFLVSAARKLQARGVDRYSIAGLFEVFRYESALSTTDSSGFKLSNNYKPYYARLIMTRESDLDGYFVLHRLKGES